VFHPDLGEAEENKLSIGAIVGIVIGCFLIVFVILLAILFYLIKKNKEKSGKTFIEFNMKFLYYVLILVVFCFLSISLTYI
jgi:amino acid transporter